MPQPVGEGGVDGQQVVGALVCGHRRSCSDATSALVLRTLNERA
jgi:hypothetical protein